MVCIFNTTRGAVCRPAHTSTRADDSAIHSLKETFHV
jgi:hypothetical protein